MREAVEGGKGEKKSQSQHRGQQAAAAAAVEAETKRAEEVERAHKQEAETRHAARVRLADELIEAGPSPTEKAPLLSAHQRYAASTVSGWWWVVGWLNERAPMEPQACGGQPGGHGRRLLQRVRAHVGDDAPERSFPEPRRDRHSPAVLYHDHTHSLYLSRPVPLTFLDQVKE